MFQCLVDVIDTAHKNDTQLFVHIRVAMFSSFSVLLQYARTENLSGECFFPPPPPPLSLVPCESHERSCLADAVKFKHFFYCLDIGKASFPEKLYLFLS